MYLLFAIPQHDLVGVEWTEGVESSQLGLLRFPYYQDGVLDFDPACTDDYRVVVQKCKERGVSQRGAIVEWARLNPGFIPDFILQMQSNPEFLRWFKSYYDTLRLMYKRLVELDLPFIPELEEDLSKSFREQAKTERVKYEEAVIVAADRRERVRWMEDGLAQLDMLDQGRLLHRLPQMTIRKRVKRGRSRSRSASRSNNRMFKHRKTSEIIQVEILTEKLSVPVPVKQFQFQTVSKTDGSTVVPRDEVSLRVRPVSPLPGTSSAASRYPTARKGVVATAISESEYLDNQLAKDSSDDDNNFQFVVPKDLLDSFLA